MTLRCAGRIRPQVRTATFESRSGEWSLNDVKAASKVPSIAPGGLEAAAGWPRFSEVAPWTDVGFGVALAPAAVGAGETGGAGDATGAGVGAAVSIAFAAAGFFDARSRTVSCIARSIGMRATPLALSTQA